MQVHRDMHMRTGWADERMPKNQEPTCAQAAGADAVPDDCKAHEQYDSLNLHACFLLAHASAQFERITDAGLTLILLAARGSDHE